LKMLVKFLERLCASTLILCVIHVPAHAEVQKNRIVVVISLDGFPAYALDDLRLPIPTLRKLAREGVTAASMRPVNPTVTWPNHTAIVTGVDASEHQVLFNGLLTRANGGVRPSIEPWRAKAAMVHAPTIYDVAFEAGLTTAQVDWVAIYGAKTITWQFPELPSPDGSIEREMIADGTVTAEQLRTFEDSSQAWQDEIWTDAAIRILEEHRPNLLLFHLLGLDDANHEYGPMSSASFTAMALLDSRVKQIVDAIERTGLKDNATVFVVSDHGFRAIKHKINPNVLLREKGILRDAAGQTRGDAWVMSEGGMAMVYATNPDRRNDFVSELRTIFTGAEGIDQVFGVSEFPKLGIPVPSFSNQAPDLVLAAKPDYVFADESAGEYVTQVGAGGTHGYLNSDPKMQAIFIAWGAGVPKGVRLDSTSNLDIAPTVAALLGVEMKRAKGHAISAIVNGAVSKEVSSGQSH
jgi:predicted AlkP superfamily pyrophosphatase or phosphodiesterase